MTNTQKPNAILSALSPLSIARMLWKRKVLTLVVWVAASVATYSYVSRIPRVYKAEALILVDSQKIPDRYVSSTVVTDAQDRLAAIGQQIVSSGRLQKIIEDFDLYHNERQTHFMEDILAMMRRDLDTVPERSWAGRTTSFRISYQGPDPIVVAQVTNKIASLYVAENAKERENQAAGTTEFIETTLKDAKKKLDDLEAAVSEYKLRHNGELPQQESSVNGVLSRLGTALEANRDAINRAQQQKVMLQDTLSIAQDAEGNQIKELQASAASATVPALAPRATAAEPAPRKRSEELEAQLAELRLRYSDKHPEVRRIQALIAEVKGEEERQRSESASSRVAAPPSSQPTAPATKNRAQSESPQLIQTRERIKSLKSQLDLANAEIENRKNEQRRILSDIAVYQGRVNGMPIREQEMAALTRDYEISKANYRSLLDKKIAAEMATDMERREKSERFTILDPARVPSRPFKPNRQMLLLSGSAFGLVFGLVLGIARELQTAALLGEWELPSGVTILGRLPYIEIPIAVGSRKKSRWRGWLPTSSSILLVLIRMAVTLGHSGSTRIL